MKRPEGLPTFQTTFGSVGHPLAYSTVAWTVTDYTLALATVIPVTGWAVPECLPPQTR